MSALRGVFRRYFQHAWLPEATLVVSCVVWLALMLAWKEWEALPFHFIYISVSVVYGLRMWHVRTAAVAIALVALSTGALTLIAVERGTEGPAELVEVPLMSLLYLTMVLHVSIRQRAAALVSQLLEQERRLRAYATHELMTPLTVARGEIELLGRHGAPLPRRVAHAHEIVLEELRRSEHVVGDLLLAARIAVAGLTIERLNADDLVLDAAERWHDRVPAHIVVDAVACGTIEVARDDLLRALDNVIANAARHSGEGDEIRIRSDRRGGALRIRIQDSGSGIAPEDLPHVFDGFYRSAEARRLGTRGAGLGLAIVRDVVEAHGGTVAIESRVGYGTAVTIELPGFVDDGVTQRKAAAPARRLVAS